MTTVDAATTAAVDAVAGIAERLRLLLGSLPARDGVAVFGGSYLTVTEAVRDRLAAADLFQDPAAVGTLDALFAGRFLDAVTGAAPPGCWRPLLALRLHPGVQPVQFALSGMAAHIEHDLPLAVVDACLALGCSPADLHGDFERVNQLLAQVEQQIRDRLLPPPEELAAAEPLLHLLGDWSVDRARGAAWESAESLWELRDHPEGHRLAVEALDRTTELLCRCLLTPL